MKFRLFAALTCVLLSSCVAPSGPATATTVTPDNHAGLAPRTVAGAKLSYTDLHSRNVFTFRPDGTYQFDYVHHSGTDTGGRHGRYKYKTTAPDVAVIDCGDSEVLTLRFETPTTATGTIEGDLRRYRFTLSRP